MRVYFETLTIIAIFSAITSAIVSSHSAGIKKYINFLTGIITVTILITPLFSFIRTKENISEKIDSLKEKIKYEEKATISKTVIINTAKETIENSVKSGIIKKFAFDENEVYVSVESKENEYGAFEVNQINIILTGKASWSDTNKVENYVEDTVGCKTKAVRK